MYLFILVFILVSSVTGPTVPIVSAIEEGAKLNSTQPSIERLNPNQRELLNVRGGHDNSFAEMLIKLLWFWIMAQNSNSVTGFPQNGVNPQHFGYQVHGQPNPRTLPKLQQNPLDRNNPGEAICRLDDHPSMDQLAHSLSQEYTEYRNKYYTDELPKRFDTTNYSVEKFKKLAEDPRRNKDDKYTRVSIDEARSTVQAEFEGLILGPERFDETTAKLVDIDIKGKGPGQYTHFDLKHPVSSLILKRQGQTVNIEEMSYKIGQKIVEQKDRFVGLENGPVSSKNVCHIVDLCYVPNHEKTIVRENILQGAREERSDEGIVFLNDI